MPKSKVETNSGAGYIPNMAKDVPLVNPVIPSSVVTSTSKLCPNCGTECSENIKFCGKCGYRFENKNTKKYNPFCHNCSSVLESGQPFCNNCGPASHPVFDNREV